MVLLLRQRQENTLQIWTYFGKHANKKDIISNKQLKKGNTSNKTADFL